MYERSPEQGGEQKDSLRLAVDERLAGIQAVKEGDMDVYFLTGPPDRELIVVTSENANEVEEKLRQAFSERFPDLAYPAN
jgi:CobQ-like glutamine amidotransferase family enzyme